MSNIRTVDARGLSCPQPVLETKKALEDGQWQQFRVLVDNETARENVARFARNQGCRVEVVDKGGDRYEVGIWMGAGSAAASASEKEELLPCPVAEPAVAAKNAVYIGNNCMGRGDDELGRKLMRGFLRTWIDSTPLPWRMIFINSGVKLTTVDDEAVEAVSMLQEKGVEVLSCGTCLEHFGLTNKLKVGRITNMFEVIETLNSAGKVVSPD